jgi:hypothetical protein
MREANLLSIISAYTRLSKELFLKYLNYFRIDIKLAELDDLKILISNLELLDNDINIFDKYFIGYKIPQIGKEFDLLRIGENEIINIELKKESTVEEIKKQLIKNKYYLAFLNKESHYFSYVSSENKFYSIDDNDNLIEVNILLILTLLKSQKIVTLNNIDDLFNPLDYLVSPFNSTQKFIDGKYFLTQQQYLIKKEILKLCDNVPSFFSIKGKAGTGKTLLTYDLAKEYIGLKLSTLIIHCGYLNNGHNEICEKLNWDIKPVKFALNIKYSEYSIVIIDEAQRIQQHQLKHIIEQIKSNSSICIFSYDEEQCLKKVEMDNNIESFINTESNPKIFKLSNKIRTNKEIASFIKCLFNKKAIYENQINKNVELNYFKNNIEAKQYLEFLNANNWTVINYTTSSYDVLPYDKYLLEDVGNVHSVIGQEFDNVVAVIDSHFYYKPDNTLATKNYKKTPHFHPSKMLFQIMTRTRKKINLVIINNEEILERCMSILN